MSATTRLFLQSLRSASKWPARSRALRQHCELQLAGCERAKLYRSAAAGVPQCRPQSTTSGNNDGTGNAAGSPPSSSSADADEEKLTFPDFRDPKQSPLAGLSLEEVREDTKYWERNKMQQRAPVYERKVDEDGTAYAIGRRKRSKAQVWLREGTGQIEVNGKSWVDYFPRVDHRDKIIRPLDLLGMLERFDVKCHIVGGGVNGQTEAVRLGIARAMQNWDPHMRPTLKQEGLLTRDSRVVESKKYGRKKARKSFQWVKR